MKTSGILLIICFITASSYAQNNPIKGNAYFLKGKLINEVTRPPGCGDNAWATVAEFDILAFSDSTYKNKEIGVIFTCPDFYKEGFFAVGATYEVKLADENQADFLWITTNAKLLDKYDLKKKLWVLEARKIE